MLGLGLGHTGLGLEPSGLGLGLEPTGLGLGLSGLDYITGHDTGLCWKDERTGTESII